MVNTTRNSGSRKRNIDDRPQLRRRCRQALADHIKQRTGLAIEPTKVRLANRSKEWYSWSFCPEAAHLFSKNLSDHRPSAYHELCAGVGVSFEAVPSPFVAHAGITTRSEDGTRSLGISPMQLRRGRRPADTAERDEANESDQGSVAQLQESLDAAEAGKSLLERQLEATQAECGRLTEELWETTERTTAREILLRNCLDMLSSMPTSVAELRDEISEAIGRDAFGTGRSAAK
ncbi:hypothetical protein DCS_04509 [Drechmeria coniospora]|uniref:Uncharacterized protein n=1 Tax=Drechmeria coniospora TaxID=98403 RepID=A0A151GK81_DRECN|nr:hypothetical protein DCS_04509 [Drechmeria coniospora]KYK57499.1 hypothetical protein DCS_04509 [Drechmeria coniospora]